MNPDHRLKRALRELGYDRSQPREPRQALLEAIRCFASQVGDNELEEECAEATNSLRRGTDGKVGEDEIDGMQGILASVMDVLQKGEGTTGVEDIDRMISMTMQGDGRPIEALRRVFDGEGSVEDRATVKLYVQMLEESLKNPHRFRDFPEPGQILQVGTCGFCPPDAMEGQSREFSVTVFQDRSARWLDEQGRERARGDKNVLLKSFMGDDQATKALGREIDEFTVVTMIGEDVYWLIAELAAIEAQGWFGTDAMSDAINRALAPYFWRDVNPLLPAPLTQTQG